MPRIARSSWSTVPQAAHEPSRAASEPGPVPDRHWPLRPSMRVAPQATRAARAAAAAIPLAMLAAACTGAPSASGAGTPPTRPAAPPAPPSLTGAHPCPALPGFTCSYLTVPLDRSGQVPGALRLQVAAADVHAPRGTLLFLTGGPGQ